MSGTNSQISRTPASALTSTMTGTTTGDMKPWRIRLELTHHGISEFNRGTLILRMDENKTFINTGPILTNETAKNNYIIECKISQTIGGSNVDGKTFQFQIKGCSIDVDKHKGSIIILELVEIQVRLSESVTTRRNLFITPKDEFSRRLVDFNYFQNSKSEAGSPNVNMILTACGEDDYSDCTGDKKIALPFSDNLKQNYTPVGLETYHELMIECIKRLSNEETIGGVFTDFYFDFESTSATNTMKCFAEEFGGVDSGITLDPKAIDTIDATKSQQASINHVKFKNHVLIKGSTNSGTLPMEECRYASILEHALLRPKWDSGTAYRVNAQVKVLTTFTGTSITNWTSKPQTIVRYYKCIQNRSATSTTPDQDTSYWQEDFVNITPFDKYGRYDLDDVVYFKVGSTVKFYRAEKSIMTISLKTLRKANPLNPDDLEPTDSASHWEDLTTGSSPKIASRSFGTVTVGGTDYDSFVDFESPNPWTNDIFDWEKSLAGLESGSLPEDSGDFVGFAQDWNIARVVHSKEDYTDRFRQVTAKVVYKMNVDNPNTLNAREIFDGQRVVVGLNPAGDFDPNNNNEHRSKVAEYVKEPVEGSAGWFFSKTPEQNDTVMDMGTGRMMRYNTSISNWEIIWNIQVTGADSNVNLVPENKNAPFHLVYDIYKGPDSTGLPNQAIEFRYCWKRSEGIPPKIYGANSRGAWMNQWFPFPRKDSTNGNLGYQFGGNGSTSGTKFCMLSSYNDKSDRTGNVAGWNNGKNSEDMGKISGLEMFVKVGFWNASVADDLDSNGTYNEAGTGGSPYTGHMKDLDFNPFSSGGAIITNKVTGDNMGNIKMVFWCIDKFDRIWNYRFQIPRNDEYHRLVIPFGHMAGGGTRNLYFGKWSRLPTMLNYTLANLDFTLKEKEHTGAGFDWKFVKGWGLQTEMGYNMSIGDYNGGSIMYQEAFTQQVMHHVQSVVNIATDLSTYAINGISWIKEQLFGSGNTNPPANTEPVVLNHQNSVIDWSTIAICNLHFKKELIVSSDDDAVGGARTIIHNKSDEFDYINTKLHAKAKRARASFYPQTWNMTTNGDVRMKFGQSFKIKGDRVPNKDANQDYITMVCKRVVHTIDHEGYTMQVIGQKKFLTTGD